MRLTPLGGEAVQGDDQAALFLGDLGQASALLAFVARQQGSRDVRIEIAHMGGGDGESCGDRGVHLVLGRALVLPQPANVHEHVLTRGGAGRRHALGLGREQAHA